MTSKESRVKTNGGHPVIFYIALLNVDSWLRKKP